MPIQLGVFPSQSELFHEFYRFYDLNKPIAFSLLSVVFIIRTTVLVASGSGAREYEEIFRDLLFTAIALVGFTTFIQMIGQIPESLIHQFEPYKAAEPKPIEDGWIGSFIDKLILVTDVVAMVITVLVAIMYTVLVGIACILGPFIVLFSIMGKQRWIMKTMITCLVITALWPVVWYLLNLFMYRLMTNESFLTSSLVFLLGTIAKFGVPALMIKSMGQISGASSVAAGSGQVFDGTTGGVAMAARLAASTATYLGGGHYVESLQKSAANVRDFAKSTGSAMARQVIPSMEKIGMGGVRALTNSVSSMTPAPIKDQAGKVFDQTKRAALTISKGLKGHDFEAFSLGSPHPQQGAVKSIHTSSFTSSAQRGFRTQSYGKEHWSGQGTKHGIEDVNGRRNNTVKSDLFQQNHQRSNVLHKKSNSKAPTPKRPSPL
jgi:hypothetical protein